MSLSEYRLNWQRKARDARRKAGLCVVCSGIPEQGKKWCALCLSRESKYRKTSKWWLTTSGRKRNAGAIVKYRRQLRAKVIAAYGNVCACCGEDEFLFLQLDHVNNDGAAERRKYSGSRSATATFYLKVIREGFPNRYRVLCSNCNLGRYLNGGVCPHEEKLQMEDFAIVGPAEGMVIQ